MRQTSRPWRVVSDDGDCNCGDNDDDDDDNDDDDDGDAIMNMKQVHG